MGEGIGAEPISSPLAQAIPAPEAAQALFFLNVNFCPAIAAETIAPPLTMVKTAKPL